MPATRSAGARSVLLPWPPAQSGAQQLTLTQDGSGKPWATIESLAAIALKAPFAAGYRITKTITPLDPAVKGIYTRGDVVRVHLDIDAQTDMTWVVVNDPVPAGATILGSGLGRDSEAATHDEKTPDSVWPSFVERGFDGYRAYYAFLPKGKFPVEYTVRLNNVGSFGLPPTRVEALYAPSTYGVLPNATLVVQPASGTQEAVQAGTQTGAKAGEKTAALSNAQAGAQTGAQAGTHAASTTHAADVKSPASASRAIGAIGATGATGAGVTGATGATGAH